MHNQVTQFILFLDPVNFANVVWCRGQYFDKHLKFIQHNQQPVAFTKKDLSYLLKVCVFWRVVWESCNARTVIIALRLNSSLKFYWWIFYIEMLPYHDLHSIFNGTRHRSCIVSHNCWIRLYIMRIIFTRMTTGFMRLWTCKCT